MTDVDDRIAALARRRAARDDARDRLAPPARYRGVPDVAWWRNPTMWVAVLAVACWGAGWVGYLTGGVGPWPAIALNTVAAYLGFTVFHECVHRAAHTNRRVNDALGWLPSIMLSFHFPVFRTCHLQHHAHTNDPENDPDHFVSHRPGWLRPLWLVGTAFNYRVVYYRNGWGTPVERRLQMAVDFVLVLSVPVAALTGTLEAVGVLFWMPALLAGSLLFFAFDFLPHTPFTSTERYQDTRIQPGRVRHWLLLGQNYHLVHHLWVSVPWFRYRDVYRELEPELRARGARID